MKTICGAVSSKRAAVTVVDPFDTVTVTAADVAVLPAASRATAVRVCVPAVAEAVSQAAECGAVVSSAAIGAPSAKNRTPATPTLSDALAVIGTNPETVDPDAGAEIDTVGGVPSGAETAPVTSKASTTT